MIAICEKNPKTQIKNSLGTTHTQVRIKIIYLFTNQHLTNRKFHSYFIIFHSIYYVLPVFRAFDLIRLLIFFTNIQTCSDRNDHLFKTFIENDVIRLASLCCVRYSTSLILFCVFCFSFFSLSFTAFFLIKICLRIGHIYLRCSTASQCERSV